MNRLTMGDDEVRELIRVGSVEVPAGRSRPGALCIHYIGDVVYVDEAFRIVDGIVEYRATHIPTYREVPKWRGRGGGGCMPAHHARLFVRIIHIKERVDGWLVRVRKADQS